MRAGLNRALTSTNSMFGVLKDTRVRITGHRAMAPKKVEGLNHGRHFGGVVGVDSGTSQCQMSFCRDDWAQHDFHPTMGEIVRQQPHPAKVSPSAKRVPPSVWIPSLKVIASVTCCGTDTLKMRIPGTR